MRYSRVLTLIKALEFKLKEIIYSTVKNRRNKLNLLTLKLHVIIRAPFYSKFYLNDVNFSIYKNKSIFIRKEGNIILQISFQN